MGNSHEAQPLVVQVAAAEGGFGQSGLGLGGSLGGLERQVMAYDLFGPADANLA